MGCHRVPPRLLLARLVDSSMVHSLENSLLNLHSVLGDSKVYGCYCDFVPKLAKRSRPHPDALSSWPRVRFAPVDKSNSLSPRRELAVLPVRWRVSQ
jgi:hypothetical protein